MNIREKLVEIYQQNPKKFVSIWYNDRVLVSGHVWMLIGCVGSVILDIKDYDIRIQEGIYIIILKFRKENVL